MRQDDPRAAYVAAVLALRGEADRRLARGETEEAVARLLVATRNALKVAIRANDDPADVVDMEARNIQKYGHPVGRDADWFYAKYGSWAAVIAAACRPAVLSRRAGRFIIE